MIVGSLFVLWDVIFGPPKKSCIDSCAKNDISCQRDCEIEGNDALDVSM